MTPFTYVVHLVDVTIPGQPLTLSYYRTLTPGWPGVPSRGDHVVVGDDTDDLLLFVKFVQLHDNRVELHFHETTSEVSADTLLRHGFTRPEL